MAKASIFKLFALTVVLACAAFAWFLAKDDGTYAPIGARTTSAPDIRNQSIGAPVASPSPAITNDSVPSLAPTWHASTLFIEFQGSNDLRLLAENAKRTPGLGGVFIANEALRECRNRRNTVFGQLMDQSRLAAGASVDPGNSQARVSALAWVEARCKNFTDSELSGLEVRALRETQAAQTDPVMRLMTTNLMKAPTGQLSHEEKELALSQLFAMKNPALLSAAMSRSGFAVENSPIAVTYVNGVAFGGLEGWGDYQLAWQLATCKLAGNCSAETIDTKLACGFAGDCVGSLGDYVRLIAGTRHAKIEAVADQLASIVDRGDASALMPPK